MVKNRRFLTPLLTPFVTLFRGIGWHISEVPCISGDLGQTENRVQNRASEGPKMSDFLTFFSQNPSRILIDQARKSLILAIFSDFY